MIPTDIVHYIHKLPAPKTWMYNFNMRGLGGMQRKVNILARVDTTGFFNKIEIEM